MLKKFTVVVVVWWYRVIIVSALFLSLRDKERLRDWEIERAWQKTYLLTLPRYPDLAPAPLYSSQFQLPLFLRSSSHNAELFQKVIKPTSRKTRSIRSLVKRFLDQRVLFTRSQGLKRGVELLWYICIF